MPALPDLRPLIINLLSRYVIQCQLEGGNQGLLQQGQRSDVQKWSHLLEELCTSLSAPCQVSYTTLQFVRYISLLEQIDLLSGGDQQAVTEVVKLLTNLCNSPELQDQSLKVKLTPLVVDAMCGISSDSVSSYSRKVMEFVTDAMDVYTMLPSISLDGEAFEATQPTSPAANRITTTTAMPPATSTAVPTTTNASSATVTPTTAPQQGKGRKRRKTSTPVKTVKKQVTNTQTEPPLLGLENRELKLANASPPVLLNDMKALLEFDPPLSQTSEPQLGEPSTASPSIGVSTRSAEVTTVGSASLVGGVLITYPPIIPPDDEGIGETSLGGVAVRRGVFDQGTESGTEINWSSDESNAISPTKDASKHTPAPVTGTETPNPVTPQGSFIKKGAWSEEESRCLLEGVEKFGEGKWKEIRVEAYSVLKHRTTNQLKDKYRNIKGRMKH